MKVLMISLDRTLLGEGSSGDIVERHQRYADAVGALDIIVFANPSSTERVISPNFRVYPSRSVKYLHFQKASRLALQLHEENNYDLLVTQDFAAPAGEIVKKKTNLPWLINIHSMFFSSDWLKYNPLKWYLLYRIKRALRKADAFRVTNKIIAQKLNKWGVAKPILIQPTPVEVAKFRPQKKDLTANSKVLFVGRLSPEKNIDLLIEVFKSLPGKLELEIVGEGREEQKLRRLAAGDPRIKFMGPKTHEEIIKIYQAADIFVLPSNTESFGKVLIEAGAAGCALVATKTTGAMSIIDDGQNGVLLEVGDRQALRHILLNLTTDTARRRRLGEAAMLMSQSYDAHASTQRLIDFWRQVSELR